MRIKKEWLLQLDKIAATASPIEGAYYRTVEFRYSHPEYLLSGEGVRKNGGRFAPVGKSSVYLSCDLVTSSHEVTARKQRFKGRFQIESTGFPCVSWEIKVTLTKCVNLTLELDWPGYHEMIKACLDSDLSISQKVGEYLFSAGTQGIIFPSSVCEGTNLIVYTDSSPKPLMEIINAESAVQEIQKWFQARKKLK